MSGVDRGAALTSAAVVAAPMNQRQKSRVLLRATQGGALTSATAWQASNK
jgi:hypothetical protein